MEPHRVEIRTPRWITIGVAALGASILLFLLLAQFDVVDAPDIPAPIRYVLLAVGIGLFAGGAWFSIFAKPAIAIDKDGLFLSACGRTIPWDEIEKVSAVEVGLRKHNIPHVGVKLVPGSPHKQKKNVLDRIFRKIGAEDYDYLISTDTLNMKWDAIVQRINEARSAQSGVG
jgi:hypothetical protein